MTKNVMGDDTPFSTAADYADPQLSTGSLDDLLRQQLSQSIPSEITAPTEPEPQSTSLPSCIVDAVSQILNQQTVDITALEPKLVALFDQLNQVYQMADIDPSARKRQFISRHGLVISPDHCVTTQKDVLRVRSFIRGAHQAIADLKNRYDDCLHIVYPACGPFAPLLLPLIGYYQQKGLYDENDLRLTLIDIQPGAAASLEAIVHDMGLSGYINEICCQDACEYQPTTPIHMVVLEAMQHGFSREGHLPMARHFAAIMEVDGVFLPQEVVLRAVLNLGQQEFVEQWRDNSSRLCEANMPQDSVDQRVELGDILRLTPSSLRGLTERVLDENTRLIECGEVVIPPLAQYQDKPEQPILLICTQIKTYNDEYLGEYDSGITHPLPDLHVCINFTPHDAKPGDLLVQSGDTLKFFYRLNGLPGFLATVGVGS
ncbi:MAG: hypothetical protein ACI8WB_000073 [Phenylobacterium sp.]|jgi:hypothetical protein